MYQNQFGNKGIALIEILISLTIFGIVASTLFSFTYFSFRNSSLFEKTIRANFLAQEAIEIVRNFRDTTIWEVDGLGTLSNFVDYYPRFADSKWEMVLGTEMVDGFSRKIFFQNAQRDSNYNIVEAGGSYDPNTKKVTVIVSWQEKGKDYQVQLVTYLTNWKK